jgi:histidyl-tRNA synthetase
MHDILPAAAGTWRRLEETAADVFAAYGYASIRTPLVEKTELFVRTIGANTDVVEKEMYGFEDRNGESISLRPEGTASVVRSVLQHGLLYQQPLRLWYLGPMFRRERPQRGRTRQFNQIGAEVFGLPGADIEIELLALCRRLWNALGIKGLALELNSLGNTDERAAYRIALVSYLEGFQSELDEDSQRRLLSNPLRILDSKNPQTREILTAAPVMTDYLGPESKQHFEAVQAGLAGLNIDFTLNSRLVRGLDYYSQTVFEWTTDALGAQGTICAGGRYDGLIELQGGKPWPGVGFAMGMERIVELMSTAGGQFDSAPDVYMVLAGDGTQSAGLLLAEQLRDAVPGLKLQMNAGGGSFKTQFRRADRSGASIALVIGEQELADGRAGIKYLREDLEQENIEFAQLAGWLGNLFGQ